MFGKVLIANRGEIAVRVIRACKELGISTVAIYSEADKDALHVKYADAAYCVGPAPAAKSYLNIPNIISTAVIAGVDAIHPGYGFLAENAYFAEICETHQVKFIGPGADVIEKMGDKAAAKKTMMEAGVPVISGSEGKVDEDQAVEIAQGIGYPVIIKAAAGGGGRGMRVVQHKGELIKAMQTARAESESAFGNGDLYIEKFIEEPRHVEVQILADEHGNVVYLGERDCSLQRRHQKVLEEAPSSALSGRKRRELGETAVKGARLANYANAGTMEFLVDKHGNFYFMEMNTRIQVEHPVTEMVTGIDLVKEQIRIAAGESLGYDQSDIALEGYAIECRINAEDPEHHFMPAPGRITAYHPAGGPGIRVDSAVYNGYVIPPFYDSMIAKLIAWGNSRDEAIMRMRRALDEFVVEGVKTTIPFQKKVIDNAFFRKGEVYTNFIQRRVLNQD